MQQKVAWILNTLFLIISGVIIALWVGYFLIASRMPGVKNYYLAGAILASLALTIFFLWLEQNWDKRVITKMAQEGKIAVANINSANKLNFLRDSSFTKYWLYEFNVCIYDKEHTPIEKTFFEKMRFDTEYVPRGSIFVTYDEEKPEQIFIIPNVLIGYIPQLQPIVSSYEADKNISIKYLDVFYNKGIVIRTYEQALSQISNSDKKEEDKQ